MEQEAPTSNVESMHRYHLGSPCGGCLRIVLSTLQQVIPCGTLEGEWRKGGMYSWGEDHLEGFGFRSLSGPRRAEKYGTMFSFYAYDGIFRIMGCTDMPSSLVRLRGREETAALGMAGAVAGIMRSWSRI